MWGRRTQEAGGQGRAALGGGAGGKGRGPRQIPWGCPRFTSLGRYVLYCGGSSGGAAEGLLLPWEACGGLSPSLGLGPSDCCPMGVLGVQEQAWARAAGVVTQRAGTCVWTSRAMRIRADRAGCGMFWGLPPGSRALTLPASGCEPSGCSAVGGGRGRWAWGGPSLSCLVPSQMPRGDTPGLPPTPARPPSQRSTCSPLPRPGRSAAGSLWP